MLDFLILSQADPFDAGRVPNAEFDADLLSSATIQDGPAFIDFDWYHDSSRTNVRLQGRIVFVRKRRQ